MAAPLADPMDALKLNFRDTDWFMGRDVAHDVTRFAFRCKVHGAFEITTALLEDAPNTMREIVEIAMRVYDGSHMKPSYDGALVPMFECPGCRLSRPLPSRVDDFTYEECERQAVLWMDLALQRRR